MTKQSTNQCTMLPKTPITEPGTTFEALVVKWNHPFQESEVVVVNVTPPEPDYRVGGPGAIFTVGPLGRISWRHIL